MSARQPQEWTAQEAQEAIERLSPARKRALSTLLTLSKKGTPITEDPDTAPAPVLKQAFEMLAEEYARSESEATVQIGQSDGRTSGV